MKEEGTISREAMAGDWLPDPRTHDFSSPLTLLATDYWLLTPSPVGPFLASAKGFTIDAA